MTAPRWLHDFELLAMVARHLHTARTIQGRAALDAGRITRDQANDAVRITRAIAKSWSRIADTRRAPGELWDGDAGGAWEHERLKTLQAFASAARRNAYDAAGDWELLGLADAIDTLIHHEADTPIGARLLAAEIPIASLIALPVTLPAVPAGEITIPDAPAAGPAPTPTKLFGEAA